MAEFHTLSMSSVYMHQIQVVEEGDSKRYEAVLTDLAVELEEVDRKFMVDRFIDALESKALKIVPSEDVDSPVPSLIQKYSGAGGLHEFSKALATRLAKVQKLTAKPGLMVIADATVDDKDCLLVAKVEHQHAMRVNPTKNAEGLKGIAIEHIRDLVFSELNKVYKIALLFRETTDPQEGCSEDETSSSSDDVAVENDQETVFGYLADVQNGRAFANYYLSDFLGMKLGEEPVVLTERFLNTLSDAIEQSSLKANEKIDLHRTLSTELQSNSPTLDAGDFISKYVPQYAQGDIERATVARGLPLITFAKDAARVKNRLNNLRLDLGGDITIDAPASLVGRGGMVLVEPHENELGNELYDVVIKGVPLSSVTNSTPR